MKRALITGGSGFIGTSLVSELIAAGYDVCNVDIASPKIGSQDVYWINQDIMDEQGLFAVFQRFMPTHVVHLAARTDTDSDLLADYAVNTEGTEKVLRCIKATSSVVHAIITSTQFVNQYHGAPKDDFDFAPHTTYGESKVISERMTRAAGLSCVWTIIRPTNIWGPWHLRYPHEFWRILGQGRYVHPSGPEVIRSYGYVKNVVWQIAAMMSAPPDVVKERVFYVGDQPIPLRSWVDGFSVAQTGHPVRVVPLMFLKVLALIGDALKRIGVKFPLTSSRLQSMTTSNDAPMKPVFDAFGAPPYSLQQGIDETVGWLRKEYPELVHTSSIQ